MTNSRFALLLLAIAGLCAVPVTWPQDALAQSGGVSLPSVCASVKGKTTLKRTLKNGGRTETGCKNGLQHGMHRVWHSNGTKTFEEEFRNGFGIGTHRSWHSNGTLITTQEHGRRGATIRQTGWNAKGEYIFYAEWAQDGEIVYQVSLDENGERVLEVGVANSRPKDFPDTGEVIPKDVLKKASEYVINKVGKTYFNEEYRFSNAASLYSRSGQDSHEYRIGFEYSPLKAIGDRGIVTVVVFDSKQLKRTYGYVATVNEDEVIEPRITRTEAFRILRRKVRFNPDKVGVSIVTPHGLNPKLTTFSWAISISTGKGDTGGSITHFVDAVSGKIVR